MTVLTATFQRGAGTRPPRVLLQVTAAPSPPVPAYSSAFGPGVDGWTASGTGASPSLNISADPFITLQSVLASQTVGIAISAERTVTGLTVGVQYRLRVTVARSDANSGNTRIRFGAATGAYVALPVTTAPPTTGTVLELVFTATATSHIIGVDQQRTNAGTMQKVYILAATVSTTAAWQGTTIRRTDVNGAGVVVREDQGGQDTAGGTMTLYDVEAALVGPVVYAVTDGNGVVTYTTTTLSAGPVVNLLPNGSFEAGVTGWQAQGTGTTFTASTADSDTGTGSGLLATGTTNGLNLRTTYQTLDAPVGKTYAARYRVKNLEAVPVDVSASLRFIQTDQATTTNTVTGTVVTIPAGAWRTVWVLGTAAALTAGGRVQLNKLDGTARLLRVDSVLLQEVPAGVTFDPEAYHDGSTPGAVWFGAPFASASMRTDAGETDAGAWITTPATATPSAGTVNALPLELVTDYAESSESNGSLHKIISRADPIANPGPLSLRAGTLELWCRDYPTAKALRALLSTGEVAQVRQPTYPGLDLYFATQNVDIVPAGEDSTERRWIATVRYAEVLAA